MVQVRVYTTLVESCAGSYTTNVTSFDRVSIEKSHGSPRGAHGRSRFSPGFEGRERFPDKIIRSEIR